MWVSRAFGEFCANSDGTWARRSHISCVRGSCVYLAISEAQESKYLNPSVGVAPAQSYLECPKPSVRSAQSQPKNSKCMDPKRGVGSPVPAWVSRAFSDFPAAAAWHWFGRFQAVQSSQSQSRSVPSSHNIRQKVTCCLDQGVPCCLNLFPK